MKKLLALAFIAFCTLLSNFEASGQIINTLAGGVGAGPAKALAMTPRAVVTDGAGNIYIADDRYDVIRKVDSSGKCTVYAGTGVWGDSGDGGPATAAQLGGTLRGLAVDANGNLYITEMGSGLIRKVSSSGIISTIAGNGTAGYSGDGGPATAAQLYLPTGVTVDGWGNVYIVDGGNYCIRKVDTSGIISTIAGNGTAGYSGDGGPATAAQLGDPVGVALDLNGNMYITDGGTIRKVNASGVISTFAGNGTIGFSGDGGPATAAQLTPYGVTVDSSGNVYITDNSNRIRKIDTSGIISTIAGNGSTGNGGDGGPATAAQLNAPVGVALDASGNMYIADFYNYRVRKVDTAGVISTVAGNGTESYGGDGGSPLSAQLYGTVSVAADSLGNVYIADRDNNRIRKINTSGVISTLAGNGISGYSGDGGSAIAAKLRGPVAVAVDGSGNVYIADYYNNRIRKVNTSGKISTVAGNGGSGYSGDGIVATSAQLNNPTGIAVDGSGNVYIADSWNNRIRKVSTTGIITTFAGNGTSGFSGDGGLATAAQLNNPYGLAVDGSGNVYIADKDNNRIRKVNASGIISTIVGMQGNGYSGDGGPATAAKLDFPEGLAIDKAGNLYIADVFNNRIRKVNTSGIISTIAGNGTQGYSGDGGPATSAQLYYPTGVAVDGAGNVYTADYTNYIRKVSGIASGIEQVVTNNNSSLCLYPNPNDGSFTLKGVLLNKEQHTIAMEVYNIVGQRVYKNEFAVTGGAFEQQITLSQTLSAGTYILKLSDGGSSVIRFTVAGK